MGREKRLQQHTRPSIARKEEEDNRRKRRKNRWIRGGRWIGGCAKCPASGKGLGAMTGAAAFVKLNRNHVAPAPVTSATASSRALVRAAVAVRYSRVAIHRECKGAIR